MLSNEAQRLIINDVKEAPFYSIMADTTPDISEPIFTQNQFLTTIYF